jgi:hypothetical protein
MLYDETVTARAKPSLGVGVNYDLAEMAMLLLVAECFGRGRKG